MSQNAPKEITADRRSGLLRITWQDGEHSEIPFAALREACPCATCHDERSAAATAGDSDELVIPLFDARSHQIESITAVGNYAINIAWADGHKYGIYQWDYLRSLS